MTNYIEEMMKTAGVDLKPLDCEKCGTHRFALGQCAETNCQRIYPEFTAEKQIEIIKLLATYCILEFVRNNKLEYLLFVHSNKSTTNQDFAQALAQLTTQLMKAGELDKQKVKEILE